MDTNDLIRALSADGRTSRLPLSTAWWGALGLAALIAAAVFSGLVGPRPDIARAAETSRFLFKFVITLALAAGAVAAARGLSRPGGRDGTVFLWLVAGPALLALAVAIELLSVAPDRWTARLVGTNGADCITLIPLIGVGPLAVLLVALRHGAPTRPGLAGAIAGLAAGGIAATFYAAKCTDDSPLFVAAWYPVGIVVLVVAGIAGGRLLVRW